MARLSVQTSDPEVAAAVLRERYDVRIDSPTTRSGLSLVQDDVGGVELTSVRHGMEFSATTQRPLAGTFVARLSSGELTYRFAQHENRWVPGDVFVAAPAGAVLEATIRGCEVEMALIPPAVFAAVAQTSGGGSPVLTGWAPVSDAGARRWLQVVEFARRTAAGPDVAPLVASATAQLVAATALDTFPNDAATAPTVADRHDAHPLTVRRAVSFIDTHPEQGLTVAVVAEAAHVTPRALQLAFRRHLGTTPMGNVRRVRLDRAHQDLLSADPTATTVTEVAARWGFVDASRFAGRYRASYGRTPNATLHA